MSNAGFPGGMLITREDVKRQISESGTFEFQQLLVAEIKTTGQAIGECRMDRPDQDGIATTDIKLLPEFRGSRYGVEIKRGLLDYLFTHTECLSVEASPNVSNVASIKMQEAVGGVRVGESFYQFPESMQGYTTPVHHYLYWVSRENWQQCATRRSS